MKRRPVRLDPSTAPATQGRSSQPPPGVRLVPDELPTATNLVLIRHGESACSLSGIVGGVVGCTGLSPTGVRQAEALRDRLLRTGELSDVSAFYCSVLLRAIQTAAIVSPGIGVGLEAHADCSFCELHPGEADGLTWQQFAERYGEPDFDSDPSIEFSPGGESWTSFVHRASSALESLLSRHRGDRVVVVCHAGVVEASMLAFLPVEPPSGRLKLRTEPTSLTEWQLEDSGWKLLRYNDAAHLSGVAQRAGSGAK